MGLFGGGGGIKLGGGKNSFWSKPLGTGKQSVKNNPLNISPLHSGTLGPRSGVDAYGGKTVGVDNIPAVAAVKGLEGLLQDGGDKSVNSLSTGDIMKFLKAGAEEGEELVGGTKKEMGEGRKDVRSRLKDTLEGNSAGANALKQDQAQAQKSLKAQQMMAGGGQMNVGQQQALQRQASRDLSKFVSDEKRQALADLSREYRGAGSDIMRSEGQYGSVLVGAQQPATVKPSSGLLTNIFGGLF